MPLELWTLAQQEEIEIEWWDFQPPLEAIYWQTPGLPPIIGLGNSLKESSPAYFRCVLAEEIGHHFTATCDTLTRKQIILAIL